jgi:hypothetical protein
MILRHSKVYSNFGKFQEKFLFHIEASLFWSENMENAKKLFSPSDFWLSFLLWSIWVVFLKNLKENNVLKNLKNKAALQTHRAF